MHAPRALLTIVAATLLGAGGGAAVVTLAGGGSTTVTTIETPRPAPTSRTGSRALDAAQVYARAKGSVASISARGPQGQATGSGFVVSSHGLIVTNAHVVEGATAVAVAVGGGATLPATVVGRDESTDLALLRVRDTAATFRPLPLADSSRFVVGDATYAIGSPFGLASTLTSGIVSALDRSIDAPNGFAIDRVIQTDAPINPGNSGGPLLDDHGRVIGVNSQILNGSGSAQSGNVGIGFAIPSSTVRAIVAQLRT
ncbi:MAG: S1C family serine protease [Conexibacter sp.]